MTLSEQLAATVECFDATKMVLTVLRGLELVTVDRLHASAVAIDETYATLKRLSSRDERFGRTNIR
jgi:hypothetical protein